MEEVDKKVTGPSITVNVNCKSLDCAIEKANRLRELLTEVSNIIDSLFMRRN